MRYTTLCYIENPAGEYLMLHRVKKENDCNRDKWIGIGGKFEDGESPEECALRDDCSEGVLEWIHKDRLAALPQWAGDRIVLDLLRRDVPFFSLKLRYQGETLVYACLNGRELAL